MRTLERSDQQALHSEVQVQAELQFGTALGVLLVPEDLRVWMVLELLAHAMDRVPLQPEVLVDVLVLGTCMRGSWGQLQEG